MITVEIPVKTLEQKIRQLQSLLGQSMEYDYRLEGAMEALRWVIEGATGELE